MEQFLYYLLRASVLMALFYGFYKLFFGKNTFHRINRFLLIFIVMLVAALPVFRFNLLPEKKAEAVAVENLPMDFSNIPIIEITELPAQPIEIPRIEILSVVFAVGLLFALVRYLIGLSQLISIIRKSEKQPLADETVLCTTDKNISPFSWMKYIVLSRKDVTADNRAIINHERAHIHLQHSLDMIFFDLFTCVFWFNPFSWLLRREVQSVHEYQADEQVLTNGIDVKQYQLLLIRKSVGEHKFALANNFRQRDLHKRITMMMKTKTNKRMKWNYAAALPVLFIAMVALSVPKLNAKVPEEKTEDISQNKSITLPVKDSVIIADNPVDLTGNPLELGSVRIVSKENLADEKLTVSGQVVDETGKPISKVAIINESDNSGTITDNNGKFVMNIDRASTLSFIVPDYKKQKVTFTKPENNFKVVLKKGEGESKELITVRIKGRDDVNEAIDNQSQLTVSGFVKGKDGFIPGVAVLIKGAKTGTITDTEGKFVIKAEKGDVLNFLMVGYKAFEYKVEKAQNNLIIVLQPDDVAAVGIGKTEDVKINAEEEKQPKLVIRGVNELKGKPLFIVDGLPVEDLNLLKADNIESISVLKNASATAIYGNKGKNGVILVTTKKGLNATGLQGKVQNITSQAGQSELSLRGVADGKKPLIVIDGEVKGKDFELNSVSPNDIESISVLKDKSAVELYGDEAKNGVVEVIMKKGK